MPGIIYNVFAWGTLKRYYLSNPSECGPPEEWDRRFSQIFEQMPFRDTQRGITLEVIHMDHPKLDEDTLNKIINVQDFDPNEPGCQTVSAFQKGLLIQIGLRPANWSPWGLAVNPTITQQTLLNGMATLSHEYGHLYAWLCRHHGTDDIARLCRVAIEAILPGQGHNVYEDLAECLRAAIGSNEVRGTFSDGKVANLAPELVAALRGWFWLTFNLNGKTVSHVSPRPGGVMYQALLDGRWRWRWIDAATFRSQEWTGSIWISI
jgi:hypothetical protein